MTARMAVSSIRLRKKALLAVTCVQMMKPMTAAPVNGAMRRAVCRDRWCISPVVFRHRNVAPCSRQISTKVMPVNTA